MHACNHAGIPRRDPAGQVPCFISVRTGKQGAGIEAVRRQTDNRLWRQRLAPAPR